MSSGESRNGDHPFEASLCADMRASDLRGLEGSGKMYKFTGRKTTAVSTLISDEKQIQLLWYTKEYKSEDIPQKQMGPRHIENY
jgi:hypothetical protein